MDWLGEIPADWEVSRIGACVTERRETVSDTDFPALSVTKRGVVPQLDSAAKSDNSDGRKLIRKDDFVINSRSDRKGSSGVSDLDGSCSVVYTVLALKRFLPAFAHHLFRSQPFQEEFYRWGTGIVDDLWSTRYSSMKQIPVPVPDLDEQRRIADFLDRETAKIDALIAKQEQLITTLDERRVAVISQAVREGIDSESHLKPIETAWFTSIPSHWHAGPLKRFAEVTLGKMVSSDLPEGDAVTIPYLRAASIQPKGRLVLEDAKEMSFSLRERKKYSLKKNDVLVVEGGSIGRSALVEEDLENWAYQNSINRVRAKWKVTGRYLNWCLQALESSGVYSTMTNVATIAHLTAEKLETVPIAVPPLEEQEEICAYLEKITRDIDLLVEKSSATVRALRERRQALISAAVTGKLEVSDGYS